MGLVHVSSGCSTPVPCFCYPPFRPSSSSSSSVGAAQREPPRSRVRISNDRVWDTTCPRDAPRVEGELLLGRRMSGMPHVKSNSMLFGRAPKGN